MIAITQQYITLWGLIRMVPKAEQMGITKIKHKGQQKFPGRNEDEIVPREIENMF